MSEPAIHIQDLTVRYGRALPAVLSGLNISICPGERVVLVGLNGSGKTTLLLSLVGLLGFDGRIRILGVELARSTTWQVRAKVGLLFNPPEDQLLLPRVIDDVAFGPMARGTPRQQAYQTARSCLEQLEIGHLADLSIHTLSHGQRQLVALAGILACQPQVLLLDEPSAGLDPVGRRRLQAILKGLDATMLIATHDLDLAEGLCTRAILLEAGKVAHDGQISYVRQLWQI